MPNVSVIIPTHNRAEFLHSAIISVLNQTFQDFEIIVVDDASKDDTQKVVSSFNDRRIKYIRHDINRGVSATRNTGIKNSSSDYIAFLDDDDEWLPEKLEKQIDLLKNCSTQVGGVYTGYIMINRDNDEIVRQRVTERGDIFNEMLIGNVIGPTSSLLLRKECLDKVGLFDGNMSFSEDWDMWIRISKEFHFECIEELLVKYYVHDKDKLSINLEALSNGIEIMLKKYGQFSALKKTLSYRYLNLGVLYCDNKNTKKGRGAFLKAIKLYPFEVRHYLNLGLSLLGADNFKKVKETKGKVIAPFRSSKISID